jgi:hypothetical protein
MARMQIQPTSFGFTPGGAFTNMTPPLAALSGSPVYTALGTATGVAFQNNGNMVLFVANNSTVPATVSVNIGKQTFSEVPAPVPYTVPTSAMASFGSFQPSVFQSQDGTGNTYVDIGTTLGANVYVGLFQLISQQGT